MKAQIKHNINNSINIIIKDKHDLYRGGANLHKINDNTYSISSALNVIKYIFNSHSIPYNLFYILKKLKIPNLIIDVKTSPDTIINILNKYIISKKLIKEICIIQPYISTNGSNMTLVLIPLNKLKIKDLKFNKINNKISNKNIIKDDNNRNLW